MRAVVAGMGAPKNPAQDMFAAHRVEVAHHAVMESQSAGQRARADSNNHQRLQETTDIGACQRIVRGGIIDEVAELAHRKLPAIADRRRIRGPGVKEGQESDYREDGNGYRPAGVARLLAIDRTGLEADPRPDTES